ncbi:Titin [Wickerhamomyces ciferrii]|uniref:Titin n=1 Tax=Wickerhamomyces ciferrii (strain ATCC 14091 / BCRC 22168 / CBS 111 / JCM 3599 / NBRC 0793 / NRRL Y-1031 F-60-10) TaxID=1206466 RepID=K0KL77_WICCF|nr:Titin [Wickerhamomyces ciferrii]CCH42942.1 Titin [Wickerhamomyces ciferrii]
MRYLRKFTGDDITVDDLIPSIKEVQIDEIPKIQQKKVIKTRFNGKKGNPTRRVVSTPIFDLVTPMEDLGLVPPPKFNENVVFPEPRSTDHKLKMPKRRPPPTRESYPSSTTNKIVPNQQKSLPATPPLPKYPIMYHHHEQRPFPKRDISMPVQLLHQNANGLHQIHDYTNIIQIYEENSPFGLYQRDVSDPTSPLHQSHSNTSSPEINSNSSSSDTASNPSSTYSFIDTPEDDVISIDPSIINKSPNSNPNEFKSKLHPRDSIKYLRSYDDTQKGFQIKTKTPPVLPQHTMNVTKKDPYYVSRASFEGERSQSSPQSPCNERDTAIFTRRSRKLPSIPGSEIELSQPQQHQQLNSSQTHASSPRLQPITFHQFQSPGYRGGLRVVNRVPS